MNALAEMHVVFDSADPDRVAKFWMAALPGYDFPQGPPPGFATWDDWADAHGIPVEQRNLARTLVDKAGGRPTISFNRVSEPRTGKNRLHLDVKVSRGTAGEDRRARVEAEAERLIAVGAGLVERVDNGQSFWIVMRDVEGNEFCVT
jgi:hypothetical protein